MAARRLISPAVVPPFCWGSAPESEKAMKTEETEKDREIREQAERVAREKGIFAECQAKYGDCGKFRLKNGTFVVVRGCKDVERVRFMTELSSKQTEKLGPAGPHKTFALSMLIHPADEAEKLALLGRYPFLAETVCTKAIELSEGQAEDLGND